MSRRSQFRSPRRSFARRSDHRFKRLAVEPLEDRRMLAVMPVVDAEAAPAAAGFDFGDAPAPYPTTSANAARHEATGPTLGALRDEEADGQPSTAADGDGADEDGVTFGSIRVGQLDATVTVNVQNAPAGAKLDAWIDFNGDGSWGGPDEQIFDSADVNNGDNVLMFDVQSWAVSGATYARFRLSSEGDLGVGGVAVDGEVEDFQITIDSPALTSRVFREENPISADGAAYLFAADVDGDGDMDLISASSRSHGKIAWHESDGSGGFTTHTIGTTVHSAIFLFAADVDSDGDIDVLGRSPNSKKLSWYENRGSAGFTEHTVGINEGATDVFAADVDGDGDTDLVVASSYGNEIVWYENDGSEGFTAHSISTNVNRTKSVFAADVDGDGDIDVLSASSSDHKIVWYENDGSAAFTAHTIDATAESAQSVIAVDVDGDGDMDVIGASEQRDEKIVWYENDGGEGFTAHILSTSARVVKSLFAADVDGDGDIDVLSASYIGFEIAWYENDGSEGFTDHTISADVRLAKSVIAADIDGDGDLDVLSASPIDGKIVWYRNVNGFDLGDAPAPYATALADDGPRHVGEGPRLGTSVDAEEDGQPSPAADGDGADEDGVTFGSIRVGQLDAIVTVNVQNAVAGAKLDAWIDFNGDGSWGGPGEQIFASAVVNNGDNALSYDVPSSAKFGNTFARFRLSTAGGLAVGGSAADGEVEDYRVTIDSPAGPPRVIDSSIRQGDVRTGGPFVYTVQFSESIAPDRVDIGDVVLIGDTVGAVVATTVAYADGTATLTATFPDLSSDQYTLTVRSSPSGIVDLSGELLDGERHATTTVPSGDGAAGGDFEVDFTVDATPPRVIASSILQNGVVAAGALLYTVRFDEPLLASTLDVSNVTLSGRINGSIAATQFSYDVDSSTLTLGFDVFPDDVYTLTLRSGGNRFTDLVGHSLDGERHSTTTVPSGDGTAGGDFVVDFAVEGGPPRVIESSLLEGETRPGGTLNYTARFSEPIDPESVVANNVILIGDTVGAVAATSITYTAGTATLTATFLSLPSDDFTLTIRSGPDGIKDLTGSQLDGEAHPATTVPSGDGAAGGDFAVHFTVDATPPRVIASSIVQNDVLSTDSISYTAQFSEPLLAGVLDVSDVRLASQRSGMFVPTQFEYDDASFTLTLGFDNLPDDFYTLTLRSGSSRFRDVAGDLLDGERHPTTTVPSGDGVAGGDFVVGFFLDSRPPRVIESSIREGDAVTAGGLTYTARFDESLDLASVIAANVHLVGSRVGEFAPTSVTYRESSSTLTATFPSLPIDQYVLTLRSGVGGLADRSGKPLDGERHATTTVPSGDGVPGGNFEVHFGIASEIGGTITSDTVLPTGSGPWRVTSNLTVPAGVTLTIEPGVVMLFEAGVEVVVRGRIVAVGTPGSRIRLTSADGAKWDGIHLRDSLEDNIFAYLDIEDAQSSDGSIGAFASVLTIDNMTFAGSRRRYVRVVNASAVIRNSIFPDRFGPDEVPGAGDDNTVEMINGTGIMTGGQMIIEGNTFGTTKGHNDIIDFVSPVRPAPILQVLNNVFLGTGDEMLDLGGDAYIEGNLFMHARRDEFNTSSGQTNAISTGDGAANATIVAVRNIFFDIEHIINLERNNSVVLEHNTVVGIPEDAVDPGNGIFQEYSLVNFVIVNRSSAGRGAHLEGNIVFDVPERIFGEPDTAQNGSPGPLSDIVVNNTLLPSERCSDVIGQRPGTIVDLGTNILCGDPQFVDPAGDFHLLPGSPAIGAGANGLDLGAFVPAGATLSEWIVLTAKDFATFTVDGPGVVAYRFRSDGGDWSDPVSVDERIELSGLTDGLHRVEAIGQNYAGVWQDEADAVVQSWTVDSTIPHVTAEDDDYSIDEDTVLVVDAAGGVLDNDDDVGSALTAELVSGPFQGTLELNADGSLRYTPDADFFGEDTFTYRAASDAAESDLATVTITVRPVNDPPIAADDTYTTSAGETIRSESGVILADNPSGYFRFDDELGATQVTDSSGNGHHGTYIGGVELQQPGATADASNKAIALDRSADRISLPNVLMDGMADLTVEFWFNTSDPGTHVPVSGSGPGDRGFLDDNEYLLLFDDQNRVGMSTGVDVDRSVRLHWTLPSIADGQWHHYIFVRNDTDDFLELFLDGESLGRRNAELTPITVAPGGLIIGEDQDSLGGGFQSSQSLNGRLDELAIFPRAFGAADAQRHFAGGQQRGLLDNDVDVDAERLSIALVDNVHSGTLELVDDGSFTYAPLENFVGVDRFTYRASDGENLSNIATVTIEVGPQQDATTAADDAYRATPGETLVIGAAGGVIFNDFDPHGDQLTATLLDDVAHGQLTLAADGSFTYEADADFIGSDRFTYRATDGTLISNLATVTITVKPSGTFVAGRHVFYNGSAFDGDDANVNALDEGAIATDKTALLPGEAATLANYTSFPGGITGVMIDVAELADPGDMDTGQFVFRAGNSADPSSWSLAPRPNRMVVREGAGVLGSDRITLTWPDGALQNTWLQVTLKATGDTGLTEPDVFYFGNAVGDTGAGNQAAVVFVDEVDAAAVLAAAIDPAAVDNVHDLNRDARVDAADVQIVQDNPRDAQDGLRLIDLSAITPPADLTGNGFVDFEDLTILLAAWNQNVSVGEGNLVNPLGTPVNFDDLTVLLAAWTGPGPAGAPVGRRLAAALETSTSEESTRDELDVERKTPRQAAAYGAPAGAAAYGARRNARRFRSASGTYGGAPLRRLQAAAVDRALEEEDRLGVRLPSRSLRSG